MATSMPQEADSTGRLEDDPDEVSDTSSQGTEPPVTISRLYSECLARFNVLISLLQRFVAAREVQELGSKLRIWAGNHGAHRSQHDRLSLDYRLREATEIHQEVRDHFKDLIQSLDEAIVAISGGDQADLTDLSYDSSSGSESSLSSIQKALIGIPAVRREHSPTVIVENIIRAIKDIINSLYKFSITIQNPANRDRTARATRISVSFWNQFDLRHVQDKFPNCSNERLIRDLAQANTKRRQLFAYHKRHQQKIQHLPETLVQEVSNDHTGRLEKTLDRKPSTPSHIGAPTVHTGNTKLTQTIVSTTRPPLVTVAVSISGRSQRTDFSEGPESTSQELLTIPPPPDINYDFDSPFVCPYCYLVTDPRDQKHWETHVLDDLRPYICTFGDCASAAVLYGRFSEWKAHEFEIHRREWFCNLCHATFDTRTDFLEHMNLRHETLMTEDDQLDSLLSLCERTSTRYVDCPLCLEFTGNVHLLQEHLAKHLRQLALYTLPKILVDDVEDDQAESDVVNVRGGSNLSNESTSHELLNLSNEQFEQLLEGGWFTPPISPFQPAADSGSPIPWDFCLPPMETSENQFQLSEYEKLAQSFAQKDVHHTQVAFPREIADIIFLLSSFSLLVKIVEEFVEDYKTLLAPLGEWHQFLRHFIFLIDGIHLQHQLFFKEVGHLLRVVDSSEAVAHLMMDGTVNSDHFWSEKSTMALRWLGQEYPSLTSTLSQMRRLVQGIRDMLFISDEGTAMGRRKGSSDWGVQMSQIRHAVVEKSTSQLEALKEYILTLQALLTRKETRISSTIGTAIITERAQALNIHEILAQAWNCECSTRHSVAIASGPFRSPDDSLELKLLIYVDESPSQVLKFRIDLATVDSEYIRGGTLRKIDSLCSILTVWGNELHDPATQTLGYLSGPDDACYILDALTCRGGVRMCPAYSLSEILNTQQFESKHRYRMAVSLASSCLHLGSTPWLTSSGLRKQNIITYGDILIPNKPCILAWYFGSIHDAALDVDENDEIWSPSKYIAQRSVQDDLQDLGILLLEVIFNSTIEDCPFWPHHLEEEEPYPITQLMVARDWAGSVGREGGPELETVFRGCLFCLFENQADWESPAFVQEVYEKVVAPLIQLERTTRWMT